MVKLVFGFDHAGHSAAYIDGGDGALIEQKDRTSRGTIRILGESYFQAGKIEIEEGGSEIGNRDGCIAAGHRCTSFAPVLQGRA